VAEKMIGAKLNLKDPRTWETAEIKVRVKRIAPETFCYLCRLRIFKGGKYLIRAGWKAHPQCVASLKGCSSCEFEGGREYHLEDCMECKNFSNWEKKEKKNGNH
jgi:hypothetical protein